jgi:hypothetical protein
MSTFTSRPSDPAVALLWGDRWWISGRSEPVVFGPISRAADALRAVFAEAGRPPRLRIIYQPSFLTSVPVNCPNSSKSTVRAALQDEHPSLANVACAWGHEPIFGGSTLLHCETEPELFLLVRSLEDSGVPVEGVWPLATVLNLIPREWPDTGALTVAAAAAERALVFQHRPDGTREVHDAAGEESAALLAATVQHAFERDDATLYIVALDEAALRLSAQVAKLDRPGRTDLGWDDVVRAAGTLSLRQPNQLLPAPSRIGANRAVTGIAVAALVTAGVLGVQIARGQIAERQTAARRIEATKALRVEVAQLRDREAEVNELTAEVSALTPSRAACAALLRAIARSLPPQIVLTNLRTDRDGFTVAGGVSGPGLTEKDWKSWIDSLQPPGGAWQLAGPAAVMPAADFALKGVWR